MTVGKEQAKLLNDLAWFSSNMWSSPSDQAIIINNKYKHFVPIVFLRRVEDFMVARGAIPLYGALW